jgi:hypothetical protein
LFVGSRGKAVGPDYLSQCIGDLTEKLFRTRVTAQVVRNVVCGFIVSEAPEEAALASEILNHSDTETTETYRKSALQIQASRRLAAAADAALRQISPPQVRLRQVAKRPGRAPRASRQ